MHIGQSRLPTKTLKMSNRILTFAQTTTYLGVAVISIIWGGIYSLDHQERDRDYRAAVRQGSNLTRVLDQYITRVIGS